MSNSSLVWFLIIGADGVPYKGVSVDKVSVHPTSDVVDFRDAVKAKQSNKLSSVDSADLIVYKNKDAFGKRNADQEKVNQYIVLSQEEPLKSSRQINGLGATEEEALIVVVPIQGNLLN